MWHVVYIYSLHFAALADIVASQYLSTPIFQHRSHLHANIETNESKAIETTREGMIGGDTFINIGEVLRTAAWLLQLFLRLRSTANSSSSASRRLANNLRKINPGQM